MADDSITNGILTNLRENLALCSKLIEAGDYTNSKESIDDLVNHLDSIGPRNETVCLEILTDIHRYISSPSLLKQEVVDALAFELPKAVTRFACVSSSCLELAEKVVLDFVSRCSPRDMLSILCEALSFPQEQFMVPAYFIPLLNGLNKVLILIQRRQYEQVKVAVPVIINTMSFELEYVDTDYENLFHKAIDVANSIKSVSEKLEGKDSDKIRALLGLYTLQIMALVSINISSEQCPPLVLELSALLQHCELSYVALITGDGIDIIQNLVIETADDDDSMDSFSKVRLGAVLGVIWGYMISDNAKADLSNVIRELQGNWTLRWKAIDMLRYMFSCANLPWKLKKHGIRFLLDVMDGIVPHLNHNSADQSIHTTMYASLQAIEIVIMYASESELRKDAFSAFKKVLADIPPSDRFDVLRALIVNSDSSSLIAILLDCVKEEMLKGNTDDTSSSDVILSREITLHASFWNPSVIELVEVILKPPEGGPPSLLECSDSVLSALNLYRFIIITESTGKSNYTGILSRDNLQKAYNKWFLPLRSLVAGTMAETQEDNQTLTDAICALYPVEMVLYRCIELVENELKHL